MGNKKLYILLDPENELPSHFANKDNESALKKIDGILLGGSTLLKDNSADYIRISKELNLPLIGFPGSKDQVFTGLDKILFLHLLNKGENNFVKEIAISCCTAILEKKIETLATAYLLVGARHSSTTASVTNSTPFSKTELQDFKNAVLYAHFSNFPNIYIEGGSGANAALDPFWITEVSKLYKGCIWAGGGIKQPTEAVALWNAGVTNVVVGTAYEQNNIDLAAFLNARDL